MKGKTVSILNHVVGGGRFHVWAGPCAVESEGQLARTARFVQDQGASGLRGGVFKMRTKASSFQGLGPKALSFIQKIKSETQLLFVSEITDPRQINALAPVVDIFQVGARNMFNYELLKELGRLQKPVLLKRAFSAKIAEWVSAVDYIAQGGNQNIILCERGIRTFEPATRNTLDLSAVALLKKEQPFPVFADPSHGTGRADLVAPMSLAAVPSGADGLLIETHPEPEKALCDSKQALPFKDFALLMKELKKLLPLFGKTLLP